MLQFLKYIGILIPNPSAGNELSTPYVQKRYNNALDYLDRMNLAELLTRISLRCSYRWLLLWRAPERN